MQACTNALTKCPQEAVPPTCKTFQKLVKDQKPGTAFHRPMVPTVPTVPKACGQNPLGSLVRAHLRSCACPTWGSADLQGGGGKWVVYGDKGTTSFPYVLYLLSTIHRAPQLPMEAKKIGRLLNKMSSSFPKVQSKAKLQSSQNEKQVL